MKGYYSFYFLLIFDKSIEKDLDGDQIYEGVGSILPYSNMSFESLNKSELSSLKINLEERGVKKLT